MGKCKIELEEKKPAVAGQESAPVSRAASKAAPVAVVGASQQSTASGSWTSVAAVQGQGQVAQQSSMVQSSPLPSPSPAPAQPLPAQQQALPTPAQPMQPTIPAQQGQPQAMPQHPPQPQTSFTPPLTQAGPAATTSRPASASSSRGPDPRQGEQADIMSSMTMPASTPVSAAQQTTAQLGSAGRAAPPAQNLNLNQMPAAQASLSPPGAMHPELQQLVQPQPATTPISGGGGVANTGAAASVGGDHSGIAAVFGGSDDGGSRGGNEVFRSPDENEKAVQPPTPSAGSALHAQAAGAGGAHVTPDDTTAHAASAPT